MQQCSCITLLLVQSPAATFPFVSHWSFKVRVRRPLSTKGEKQFSIGFVQILFQDYYLFDFTIEISGFFPFKWDNDILLNHVLRDQLETQQMSMIWEKYWSSAPQKSIIYKTLA